MNLYKKSVQNYLTHTHQFVYLHGELHFVIAELFTLAIGQFDLLQMLHAFLGRQVPHVLYVFRRQTINLPFLLCARQQNQTSHKNPHTRQLKYCTRQWSWSWSVTSYLHTLYLFMDELRCTPSVLLSRSVMREKFLCSSKGRPSIPADRKWR